MNSSGGEGAEVIYSLRNDEKLFSKILNELAKEGPNDSQILLLNVKRYTKYRSSYYRFLCTNVDAERLKKNYKDYAVSAAETVLDYKGIQSVSTEYYTVKKGDTLHGYS